MGFHAGGTSDGTDGDGVAAYGAVLITDKMARIGAVTPVFRARGAAGGAAGSLREA